MVDVDGREELRANDDWSVVSFVEEGDGLPDRLVGELEGRGWALVASGQEGVWTGVKEGGRCSWLALSCTWVGDVLRDPSSKCADGMRGDAGTAFARLCTVRDGDRAPFQRPMGGGFKPASRLRGLAGRRPDSTVMVFPRCRDVHTLTMRHPLDVAFLDRRGRVIAVHRLVLLGARLRCGRAWAVVERFARPGPWFVRGDVCLLPDAPRDARKPRAPALARTQAAPATPDGRRAVKNETKRRIRHR
ncbi:MAG: DUF192 domain-containing protein [Adlercreutzia equolifaciens]